ncbi:Por secretion system C-terminal sorting domain-containing protein [Fodinibius salinus]|uniref:Por secretion system C-terminal sorting domain-containing protein n=1 Tax=Fodinibius salinus TaxID=860790 RepID=A0A5D3YF18_9BACT|nr:T9SS type A sorting domain-containing protein [Fodinibius salinus]TYP92006.1 Por secretion system C-terminal sorting domain-containing protein [Fodinibius salinus]
MSKKAYIFVGITVGILIIFTGLWYVQPSQKINSEQVAEEVEENPIKMKKARGEYFHRLLRDPATGKIPQNIRSRELKHAQTIPSKSGSGLRPKTVQGNPNIDLTWELAGPKDLGGRTRALAIDERNSDIIIAGGVSGGIWKSTDGGSTWNLRSDPNQNMSVTSLAQSPVNLDNWYYASGEVLANSASAPNAAYYGQGIYKSTDNGDTWQLLSQASSDTEGLVDKFNSVSRIRISPTTGSIFIASTGYGIYRSTDGQSFSSSPVLGTEGEQLFTDVTVASDGTVGAVISEASFSDQSSSDPANNHNPGIYISDNDGQSGSWTEITPSDFPDTYRRSVLAFAPSSPDILYVFTLKGANNTSNQGVSFYKIDISDPQNPTAEDRSANLPDFGGSVGGVNLQGGYNMVVSVKPDDSDFVMIGGTNLFRSRDGFSTAANTSKDEHWIGGYAKINNVSQYPGQHPDQHVVAYDPANPDRVWSGHDGGISVSSDITASSVSWQDKDEGYVTGQFYTVAIPSQAGDNRYMGGTQDNGTPYFRAATQNTSQTNLVDISSGDGSYAFWGTDYAYVSSQQGKVTRLTIENDGNLTSRYNSSTSTEWTSVYPSQASGQLFVHPFAIDPNDDAIMYYPSQANMWINTELDQISNFNSGGTTQGWSKYDATTSTGYQVTTLAVTTSQPSDRLYYATSSTNGTPEIFYSDDASNNFTPQDISISGAPSGAYVHDIAVNPIDGDEAMVVMSNYDIVGLYHTADGGTNWTAIEGDLEGTNSDPGPSLRSATILPTQAGPVYFVGTSTGIYSTGALNGPSTTWVRESDDGSPGSIGYSIVEHITSRPSDGTVAAATHGRGIFAGSADVQLTSDGMTPSAPTGSALTGDSSSVELQWDANTESDITKYYIYRGLDSNTLAKYDSVAALGSPSYTDTNVGNNFYYYKITAKDIDDNESNASGLLGYHQRNASVTDSWNLIGSPLTSSTGSSQIGNDVTVYGFAGSYSSSSDLESQTGYWVKSRSGSQIGFAGEASISASITLDQGWNLIAGIADTVQASAINDPGAILSSADIFKYEGGTYQSATEINPNDGYWINANQSGTISMAVGASTPKNRIVSTDKNQPDVVTFRRGNNVQKFYVSPSELNGQQRQSYLMPPQSPKPKLDVRSEEGYRIADKPNTELQLTTYNFPVKARLSAQSLSEGYTIKGVTDQDTVFYDLAPGKTVSIDREYEKLLLDNSKVAGGITETSLKPNYPNPFNPSTKIRYQLSSEADVNINVYNVLGRKVRTLVNDRQRPGKYNLQFDGSDLASGTYFIHLKAGNTVQVQKMTLIK